MKLKRTLTLLLLLFALAFIFLFAAVKTGALDFWMHQAAGRYIIQHQGFPDTDPFTYTAGQSPWVNGWWLSQVIFYLLHRSLGPVALVFLKAFLVTGLWGLMLKLALDAEIELYLAVPLVLLGTLAGQESWGLKPHLFTFFLFAFTYYVLYKCRGVQLNTPAKIPWALAPLFACWANIHPGYPAGLLLIFLFVSEQILRVFTVPPPKSNRLREISPYMLFAGASVLACFFTPFGIEGFRQPFIHVKDTGLLKFLGEWVSPSFLYPSFYPFEFILLLLIVLLALSPYRLHFFELASLLIFGHMALQSFRHIPFFVLVSMLPLGKALMGLTAENPRRRPVAGIILALAVLYFIISSPVWVPAKKAGFFRELEENPPYVPTRAVKILRDSNIPGPLFCTYSWNGYEIWALGDKYKVFIDGRTLLYPPPVLQDYLHLQEAGYFWETVLKKYHINVILVDNGLPLSRLLSLSPNWVRVYEDNTAAVFRRRSF